MNTAGGVKGVSDIFSVDILVRRSESPFLWSVFHCSGLYAELWTNFSPVFVCPTRETDVCDS